AELGQMLADSRGDLGIAPWLVIGPGVALVAMMAGALLIGDAVRDALDPHPAATPRRRHRRRQAAIAPTSSRPTATATAAVLGVRGLEVRYPDGARAVRGVDLHVHRGERVAIVGESGCGKTTIARAVLGLLPPGTATAGSIELDGHDVLAADRRELRALRGPVVGYIAQDPYAACDPLQRVGRHVEEPWRAHGLRPAPGEAARRVGELGLADAQERLRQRPQRWSGGMLQRATTAAAAAHDPRLIIADEPTSALDTQLADGSLTALDQASDALLLISHDLRLVAEHSDRTAVMYAGRIVELGPTRDVTSAPRHPYSQALLAASPAAGGGLPDGLPGAPPALIDEPHGCPFAPRCHHRTEVCASAEPPLFDGVACWNAT
ncbi:MAG: Peptide/nickel transport system ATP-binding protein, partial [Ilumatobacteraceae bacterium]|nr:Peptide/nickel transport system ATP-binding protein [Ilumatobacteraceae bacterium]